MKARKQNVIITVTVLSLASTLSLKQAYAEELSLGVYPPITSISGLPGQSVETEITVLNSSRNSIILQPVLQPFTASSDADGTVSYLNAIPTFFRFIRMREGGAELKEMTLAPGEKKTVSIIIDIPEKAISEDHYFSVIFMAQNALREIVSIPETVSATSYVTGGVASHVLLSVSPTSTQSLTLTKFSAPFFSQESPVPFQIRITNQDSHLARLHGKIEIKNLIGMKVDELIISDTTILANSTKAIAHQARMSTSNNSKSDQSVSSITDDTEFATSQLLPGIYRAEIILDSSTQAGALSENLFFTLAPVSLLFSLVIIILVLGIVLKRLRRKLRQ